MNTPAHPTTDGQAWPVTTVSLAQTRIDALVQRLHANEPVAPDANHAHHGTESQAHPVNQDRLHAARLCRRIDRLQDAIAHFNQLLTDHPNAHWLHLEAGHVHNQMGETAQAAACFKQAARDKTTVGQQALEALGKTLLQTGALLEAGWAFFNLSQRTPMQPTGWAGLLVCASLAKRPKLLLKVRLAMAERFASQDRTASLAQMWLHASFVDTTRQAERELKTLLTTPPPARGLGRTSGHAKQGVSIASRGLAQPNPTTNRTASAADAPFETVVRWSADVLKQHTQNQPNRADACFHLAQCQHQLGQHQASQQAIKQALAINPNYQKAQALAGQLAATLATPPIDVTQNPRGINTTPPPTSSVVSEPPMPRLAV